MMGLRICYSLLECRWSLSHDCDGSPFDSESASVVCTLQTSPESGFAKPWTGGRIATKPVVTVSWVTLDSRLGYRVGFLTFAEPPVALAPLLQTSPLQPYHPVCWIRVACLDSPVPYLKLMQYKDVASSSLTDALASFRPRPF
jgi:hypothetical protein